MGAVLCCETREAATERENERKKKRASKENEKFEKTPSEGKQSQKSEKKEKKRSKSKQRNSDLNKSLQGSQNTSFLEYQRIKKQSIRKVLTNKDIYRSKDFTDIKESLRIPASQHRHVSEAKRQERALTPRRLAGIITIINKREQSDDSDDSIKPQPTSIKDALSSEAMAALQGALDNLGQGHLLAFLDECTDEQKMELISQLGMINPESCNNIYEQLMAGKPEEAPGLMTLGNESDKETDQGDDENASFQQVDKLLFLNQNNDVIPLAIDIIKNGNLALVIYAAEYTYSSQNQNFYNIGLMEVGQPYNKPALEIIINQFFDAQKRVIDTNCKCPIIILTKKDAIDGTKQFLKLNNYFGVNKNQFCVVAQSNMPLVDLDGRIIMSSTYQIQMSTGGTGALLEAIANEEKVKSLIQNTTYCQLINVYDFSIKICDLSQLGLAVQNKYSCVIRSYDFSDTTDRNNQFNHCGYLVNKNGKIDILERISEGLRLKLPSKLQVQSAVSGLLIDNQQMLDLLKNGSDIGNFYKKDFECIPYFDEEEDICITPDNPNGFVIRPSIQKLIQKMKQIKVFKAPINELYEAPFLCQSGFFENDKQREKYYNQLIQNAKKI